MTVYFDKENLISLVRSEDNFLQSDIFRLIKRNLNVCYCWNSESGPETIIFRKQLTTGRGQLKEGFVKFDRPITSEFYMSVPDSIQRGVFLLNDISIENLKAVGNILIEQYDENYSTEAELLKKLFFEDYQFVLPLIIGQNLKSFSDLKKFCLPCTDIIVHDKFLFESSEELAFKTLNNLLAALLNGNKSQVNIVIYAITREFEFKRIEMEITKIAKGITGFRPLFTLVRARDTKGKERLDTRVKRHDRHIITNHVWFNPGDSFNLFDLDGSNRSGGDNLDVKLLSGVGNREAVDIIINRIQQSINELKLISSRVLGDRKSNFLKF